jgi:hypothetical protein
MGSRGNPLPIVEPVPVQDLFVTKLVRWENVGGLTRFVFGCERETNDGGVEMVLMPFTLLMEHATAMLVGQQMQMTARPAYEPTRVLSRHQPMHAPVKINGDSD